MTGLMATDDISPELALVSPELSAEERERMPERPWEKTAGGARRPPASRNAGRVRGDSRQTVRQGRTSRSDLRPRRRSQARAFLAIAFVSAVLVGIWSLRGDGDPEAPRTAAEPATPGQLTAGPPRLLPNAGYVVSPRGSLLTARSGGSIVTFTLPLRCGGRDVVIRDIPVSGRSFRVARRPTRRVTVRVSGRVVSGQEIVGTASAGAACTPRRVAFRARVS